MYLREDTRKNKDGSTVTYVRLAHNVRDPNTGHSKANIIHNFCRYLPPADELEVQAQLQNRGQRLRWKNCRTYGGTYFVGELLKKLNFPQIIAQHIQQRQFSTPIAQAIWAMVANRCLAPRSKLAVSKWVEKKVYLPDLPRIEVQVLYRAMDFILAQQNDLEQQLYWAVADLLNLEVDLIFFDTTSTYFETETETDLKKRGHSKDHRDDLPQVVIGLAVTRDGIPVKHWVFEGNTQDLTTIETIKNGLSAWKLNR